MNIEQIRKTGTGETIVIYTSAAVMKLCVDRMLIGSNSA